MFIVSSVHKHKFTIPAAQVNTQFMTPRQTRIGLLRREKQGFREISVERPPENGCETLYLLNCSPGKV